MLEWIIQNIATLTPAAAVIAVGGWIVMLVTKSKEEHTKRHGIDTEAETRRMELANSLTVQLLEEAQEQMTSMADELAALRIEESKLRQSLVQMETHLHKVREDFVTAINLIEDLILLPSMDSLQASRIVERAQAFLSEPRSL